MRRIPCEGSQQKAHYANVVGICAMCGEVVDCHHGVTVDHDRDDILEAIDNGEFR